MKMNLNFEFVNIKWIYLERDYPNYNKLCL